MEMLVTKFSKGKYRNEGELFAEPISDENVKLMGKMIALQLFRARKKHYCKIADRLYIGLIKDLHHMNEVAYTVSDGYDYAQAATCFLLQYKGRKATDVCYTDKMPLKGQCIPRVQRVVLICDPVRARRKREAALPAVCCT